MNNCRISDIFDEYKEAKRNALAWLFCYLYSFNSMKSDGNCHPSTKNLSISGETKRSVSAIKRYLAILESMNLIQRSYPDGRTHVFHATEKGENLYHGRRQAKKYHRIPTGYPVDNFPTELLIKNKSLTYSKHNTKDLKSINTFEKPKFTKTNLMFLNLMAKKYTENSDKCDKIVSEIVYSIVNGCLMCKKGTGTYHAIPNAINIAVWLLKQGKWTVPKNFDGKIINEVKTMIEQNSIKCAHCEQNAKVMKDKDKKGKFIYFCEDHYFDNFEKIETDAMHDFLWNNAQEEFKAASRGNEKLTWSKFVNYRGSRLHPKEYVTENIGDKQRIIPKKGGEASEFTYVELLLAMSKVENYIRGRHKNLRVQKVVKWGE